MALPSLSLAIQANIYGNPETGDLLYKYAPFQNLLNSADSSPSQALNPLRLEVKDSGLNISEPIDISTEISYDDSVNLIVSDKKNPPKIINSRFYLNDSTTYTIADRKGNIDTNIYSKENFNIETSLIKVVNKIITVDFLGIKEGGSMKIGNYTFYFKLSDYDGNETDFIAESGKVVCHIGTINSPKSIRGGQLDEDSNKLIKFQLKNLDLAYDFINVYYTRSTGTGNSEITQAYKIDDRFKIVNNNTTISITGYEKHIEIDESAINVRYTVFDGVKTIENCQNLCFAGNIDNDYSLFKTLERYSLYITPEAEYDYHGIGYLDENYNEKYLTNGYEYYNANNIYYKLGYWDEDIYRFGIVYIMNNYTLSPVFNIRGRKIITGNEDNFGSFPELDKEVNYGEDYIIQDSEANVKGVFKLDITNGQSLVGTESIKPLGIKFKFNQTANSKSVLDGDGINPGLKDLTKGFFIVRQKRIPTILTQAIGIASSKKSGIPLLKTSSSTFQTSLNGSYFGQSFLINTLITGTSYGPKLGNNIFAIPNDSNHINYNSLLCPEATLKKALFNTFFNTSEFVLKPAKFTPIDKSLVNKSFDYLNLSFIGYTENTNTAEIKTTLLTIDPGIELIKNNTYKFSTQAGNVIDVSKYLDPINGAFEDPSNQIATDDDINLTTTKIRGVFNSFIGTESNNIISGEYYNIFQKDYSFSTNWRDYFLLRYNDSSPYYAVSDRIAWENFGSITDPLFRGDCYINTITQRIFWNFIDTEMPTNKTIVDPWTWYKNYRVVTKSSTIVKQDGSVDASTLTYRKVLPIFTYKKGFVAAFQGDAENTSTSDPTYVPEGLIEPDGKKFKKYSEINGLFGLQKINKPDINAVPLGYWVTIKICSNTNLAMRDIDFSNPDEEALHGKKRGFYPYNAIDMSNNLPESDIINQGISKSISNKFYFEVPDVPFIKTNFSNRIYYSNLLQTSSFTNGNRIFESQNYQDYTMEYGALVKLVEWYGRLIAVMEHGVLMIPVNERAMMTNASGENVYINTENVLPKNPKVLSNTFGSLWKDSVIKTSRYIYGIDTVAKKIWRTNGEDFENISDVKIQKFLNDKIHLREFDKDISINTNFIKTHYNAFKQDVMFIYKYGDVVWNLCWNELTNKWTTQYTWFPEFSENINNIFYTFANQEKHTLAKNYLYKHGFAGYEEELGNIEPTKWYDEQHPFEYEFVVTGVPGVQKIFNNLKIVSNLAEPESFYYEIVGEGFDWVGYKKLIIDLNNTTLLTVDGVSMSGLPTSKTEDTVKARYLRYLTNKPTVKKLPYIYEQSFTVDPADPNSFYRNRELLSSPFNMSILRDLTLREHNKTKERLVNVYQKGTDIKKYGRLKGNMQYLEDAWDLQIQPIVFQYAYLSNEALAFTGNTEMRIRDKYIKIRVKYNGEQYAIVNALKTMFTISYA